MRNRLNEFWQAAIRLRAPGGSPAIAEPRRLSYPSEPPLVYAIGDVHGRLDLLLRLEETILRDRAKRSEPALLVMLGDLVDRGPASAQVIDHVLSPAPSGIERICLRGNHEAMMQEFIADPRPNAMWLGQGGRETLLSYGVPPAALDRPTRRDLASLVHAYIPADHIEFLHSMPVLLQTPGHVYVHAGIDASMSIDDQPTDILLWYRDNFVETYAELGKCVVHGHSVTPRPLVTAFRIAIDTGACETGTLSAVAITPAGAPRILDAVEVGFGMR